HRAHINPNLPSFPTRRSSDLITHPICNQQASFSYGLVNSGSVDGTADVTIFSDGKAVSSNSYFVKHGTEEFRTATVPLDDCIDRSEEHTSELQSRVDLVCRLL